MSNPKRPIVLKFGGSSLGSPERIRAVARIIASYRKVRSQILVVVSAMGDTTDELIQLALKVSPYALSPKNRREMDMLLSAGERVSMALLSMSLSDLGLEAVSFTGSQSGILTDTLHGEARISQIRPIRIEESLNNEKVVIVAGFQGVSQEKEVTTLGRGGSDTSAVAMAVALGANEVNIYTDVDGVFTADPRLVPEAKKLSLIPWDIAIEAAQLGAQVLHPRCIELAWKNEMPIRVLSSFNSENSGTLVKGESQLSTELKNIEGPKVFTLAVQKNLMMVEKRGLSFADIGKLHKNLCSSGMKFTIWQHAVSTVNFVFENSLLSILEKLLVPDSKRDGLAQLSIVGVGLLQAPEIYAECLDSFQAAGLEIVRSGISTNSISVLCKESPAFDGLTRELHSKFIR